MEFLARVCSVSDMFHTDVGSRVPNAGLRPAEGRPKGGPRCVPQALEVVKVGRNDGGIIMIEKEQKKTVLRCPIVIPCLEKDLFF